MHSSNSMFECKLDFANIIASSSITPEEALAEPVAPKLVAGLWTLGRWVV